ncbi:MAG: hypothetical protein Q9217_006779 [Psora testacea]
MAPSLQKQKESTQNSSQAPGKPTGITKGPSKDAQKAQSKEQTQKIQNIEAALTVPDPHKRQKREQQLDATTTIKDTTSAVPNGNNNERSSDMEGIEEDGRQVVEEGATGNTDDNQEENGAEDGRGSEEEQGQDAMHITGGNEEEQEGVQSTDRTEEEQDGVEYQHTAPTKKATPFVKTERDESSLFLEQHTPALSPPRMVFTRAGGGTEDSPIDLDSVEDLNAVTPAGARGIRNSNGEMLEPEYLVQFNGRGGGKQAVARYGTSGQAIYRIEDVTGLGNLTDVKDISNPKTRVGEDFFWQRDKRVWKYGRKHVVALLHVAIDTRGAEDNAMDAVSPEVKEALGKRYTASRGEILWYIEGEYIRSWETRTVINRVWSSKKGAAAEAIFKRAGIDQDQFVAGMRGEPALRRSGSPDGLTSMPTPHQKLGTPALRQNRDLQGQKSKPTHGQDARNLRTPSFTPEAQAPSKGSGGQQTPRQKENNVGTMADFLADFCQMFGVKKEQMSPGEKVECFTSWKNLQMQKA